MQRHNSQRHNVPHDQRSHQPSRPGRNQLRYGDDASAYEDDFWSREPGRSQSGRQRIASDRSSDEDRRNGSRSDPEHRQHSGHNASRDTRSFRNERYEGYPDQRRYSDYERRGDVGHDRYQGDGRFGWGGESRRGRWTEDESFYEYRASLHNPNAMRNAWSDMHREDAGYFDRDYRHPDSGGRPARSHNISDEEYYRQQQRSQNNRPRRDEQWNDNDDRRHRQGGHNGGGRYRQ